MGASAATWVPLASGALGAAGSYFGGERQRDSAQSLLEQQLGQGTQIPSDVQGLRGDLSSFFRNALQTGDFADALGADTPFYNSALRRLQQVTNPDFLEQTLNRFDPDAVIQETINANLPVFRDELNRSLGKVRSAFGPQGARYSSDLNRELGTQSRLGTQGFIGSVVGQKPQLINSQIQAASLIPALIAAQTGVAGHGFQAGLSPAQTLLGSAVPFATAGLSPPQGLGAYQYGLGSSGTADALSTLGNFGSLYPLFQEMAQNNQQRA